jgi:hypothetical protein
MRLSRRTFITGAVAALAALLGFWRLARRKVYIGTVSTPPLKFLTPSEYRYINAMAREIVPDEPVLRGQVDVARNIDWYFGADNASPDFLVMMRYLRLIRLADPVLPVLMRVAPGSYEDIISFKRALTFLGYYSDANGEADLPAEKRVVWSRLGYGGPKGEDWYPPDSEAQLDRSQLADRVRKEGA